MSTLGTTPCSSIRSAQTKRASSTSTAKKCCPRSERGHDARLPIAMRQSDTPRRFERPRHDLFRYLVGALPFTLRRSASEERLARLSETGVAHAGSVGAAGLEPATSAL